MVVAVLAAAALVACSGNGEPPRSGTSAKGDELVALAKKEGQVVWYTGNLEPAVKSVQKAFKQAYGIDVVVPERLSSAALSQRIDADVRSNGVIGADVVLTTDLALSAYLKDKGYSTPVSIDMFPGLDKDFMQGDAAVGCGVIVPIIAYNTSVLGDFKIKSWDDLLDPKLSGKIMVNDPRGSAAWAQLFSSLLNDSKLGEGYLAALKKQNYQPVASSLVGAEQLIAGQGGVLVAGIPGLFAQAMADKKPIEIWYPTAPAPVAFDMCLLTKAAAHPNAAKLFLQWLMTEEGQAAMTIPDRVASPLGNIKGAVVPLPANYLKAPPPEKVQQDLPRILNLLGFN
ncbi:extracellular solute-binding protein [Nonomuraea sp. NPDC005650]|uniref:ABC transporter substrate-binding protein n=1 Tax=Nonomuraea sp. NPDC005650 TaxID=3157045 RepID=UPI0033AAAF68